MNFPELKFDILLIRASFSKDKLKKSFERAKNFLETKYSTIYKEL